MVNNYTLVNPHITGDAIMNNITSKNSLEAAKILYNNLSEKFTNSPPSFYFSIKKGGSDKLYHFRVIERKDNNDNVNFLIKPYKLPDYKQEDIFNKELENTVKNIKKYAKDKKGGGSSKKKKKSKKSKGDDSSSSSSSSDLINDFELLSNNLDRYVGYNLFRGPTSIDYPPPLYWWYYPSLYSTRRIFLPSLVSSIHPFMELSLCTYNCFGNDRPINVNVVNQKSPGP